MIRNFLRRLREWTDDHWVEFFGIAALGLLLVFVMWRLIIHTVPPGSVGVLWYRFAGGTVTAPEEILPEGLHVIFPWDKIYIYDARLQRVDETVTGLSVDGLDVSITVITRFVIEAPFAGFLHKSIGPTYQEKLVIPELRALVLAYIAENEAEDLYSARRAEVQAIIQRRLQASLTNISTNVAFDESYVTVEDVLIEEISLPDFVKQAIREKERIRHISEAYEFRLEIEEKERQRKRIEAEGIRSFQEIVAPGITPSYLRWRGIEATLELAESNNAKIVIIGGSEDGLPLILNTESVTAEARADLNVLDREAAANASAENANGGLLPSLPDPLGGLRGVFQPAPTPAGPTATASGPDVESTSDSASSTAAQSTAESNDSQTNPAVQSTAQAGGN